MHTFSRVLSDVPDNFWIAARPAQVKLRLPPFLRSLVVQNLVANYAGAAINSLAPLLAIPLLIRVLGNDAWGLVAFVTLMVSLMMMLNTGIAQALVRELAHRWANGDDGQSRTATLLRSYERLYWTAAMAIALAVLPTTPWIADTWLKIPPDLDNLGPATVAIAVVLFVANLPGSLYRATLLAVQEHVRLNSIRTVATIGRLGIGVAVVTLTSSILGYLIVIAAFSFLETFAMAFAAWRLMPRRRREVPFELAEVRSTLRFTLSMSLLAMLGVATTQLDRFFVSMLLPIDQLGIYSIAVSLAFGVLQLSYPLFTSVMPTLVAIGNDRLRRRLAIRNLLLTVLAAVIFISILYILCGTAVLTYWLGDAQLAQRVSEPLALLLIGVALNTIYNIGYTNWISLGHVRDAAIVNITSGIVAIVVLPVAIGKWGITGAASSFVIINVVGAAYTVIWLALAPKQKPDTQNL
jgi:O-antigen/teichoic acid export membrane protein